MQYIKSLRATVLVYTMVLVVIWVFMATVVLNIAVQLSVEYDNRNIEVSMASIIKTKGDLSIKYSNDLNATWSGYVDILSCPTGITMSWTTVSPWVVDTTIRYLDNSIVCHASAAHNGIDLNIFFNSDYNDLEFAQFDGSQIGVNSGSLVWVFSDSDSTTITIPNTWYYSSDMIDDNFDSDNYSTSSTWGTLYPDGYYDNDNDAKLMTYGYILEWSWLYNAFWSNTKIKQYIQANPNNLNGIHQTLWSTWSWYLKVDINGDHAMFLYEIDRDIYNDSNEMVVNSVLTGTWQSGGVWYLQDDLSIATGTGSAYNFNFIENDYALFIENTGSWALLYQIRWESSVTWSWIYINPIDDTDESVLSYLWSHVLVDDQWKLIWDMFEVFWLK